MMLRLEDDEMKAALAAYVRVKLDLKDETVTVTRITRHQGGRASADVEVSDG